MYRKFFSEDDLIELASICALNPNNPNSVRQTKNQLAEGTWGLEAVIKRCKDKSRVDLSQKYQNYVNTLPSTTYRGTNNKRFVLGDDYWRKIDIQDAHA